MPRCRQVVPLGDSALVELTSAGGATLRIVLNTNRTQTFEPDAFSNLGADPTAERVLVVKSTNHFFPAFAKIARAVLYVDTGLSAGCGSPYPSDPRKAGYKKVTRGLWPWVDDPHGTGCEHVPWNRP